MESGTLTLTAVVKTLDNVVIHSWFLYGRVDTNLSCQVDGFHGTIP
jgi:hypothetical protein